MWHGLLLYRFADVIVEVLDVVFIAVGKLLGGICLHLLLVIGGI